MSTSLYLPPINARVKAGCEFYVKKTRKSLPRSKDNKRKATDIYTLDGKYVDSYPSRTAAAKAIGVSYKYVSRAVTSKTHIVGNYRAMEYETGVYDIGPVPRRSYIITKTRKPTRIIFDDGYFLDFDSQEDAAKALNLSPNRISTAIKKGCKVKKHFTIQSITKP